MEANSLTTGLGSNGLTQNIKERGAESQLKYISRDTFLCLVVRRKTTVKIYWLLLQKSSIPTDLC